MANDTYEDRSPRLSDDAYDPDPGDAYEPKQGAHTADIAEQAALFGATPRAGDIDNRPVWVNRGEPLDFSENGPAAPRAAHDQITEGVALILDAVAPDGFQMADQREAVHWGIVNVFHSQTNRMETTMHHIKSQSDTLGRAQDGTDQKSTDLEEKISQLLSSDSMRSVFESIRDHLAYDYTRDHGDDWTPRRGSLVSQTADIASVIEGPEYVKASKAIGIQPEIPDGTRIAVTGSRATADHQTIWDKLDKQHKATPDMVLLHGGDKQGTQKIAADWAKARGVPQTVFMPAWTKDGKKAAIPRRDARILKAEPTAIISFVSKGTRPSYLHEGAVERGLQVDPEMLSPQPAQAVAKQSSRARASSYEPAAYAEDPQPRTHVPTPETDYTAAQDAPPSVNLEEEFYAYEDSLPPILDAGTASFEAFIDRAAPLDHVSASLRQPLIRSMLEGLHTTIHGPAGLSEQAYALTIQVENLDRGQDGTEIPMTEHYNKHHQLRELNQNIEHAENLLARLAEKHEQETGEEWQPPAPEGTTRQDQRRTGAMTEAIKTTEQIYDRYHQARLPPGTPVALTSLADCADKATVFDMLNAVKTKYPDIFLIHGASDASSITAATEWAKKNKIHQVVFKPEWKKYPGRAVVQRDHDMIATQPRGVLDFTTSDKTTALADLAVQHDIKIMPAPKPAHREDQAENRAIERDAEIERSRTADHQQDRSQANDQGMSM